MDLYVEENMFFVAVGSALVNLFCVCVFSRQRQREREQIPRRILILIWTRRQR